MNNSFLHRFFSIVDRYPNNIAILTDGQLELTYQALRDNAFALAERLRQEGAQQGYLVALSIDKSAEYVTALLASWIAGGAFLPLDPGHPEARRQHILNEARPHLILTGKDFQVERRAEVQRYPDNLAYVIYTSGSTGVPKGVMVPHDGIVNFMDAQMDIFQMSHQSRSLFYLSTVFDASVSDIGVSLLSGATLCIESQGSLHVAKHLPEILKARGITHMDIPPSLLSLLDITKMPDTLETVLIGGEKCPLDTIKQWSGKFRLINIYGPTEATVCTSMALCRADWQVPSIGCPIPQMEYKIMDNASGEVAPGAVGELCISGLGLALGYVNNADLTKEKFILSGGVRLYRTGDLVKQDENGEYILVGRIDRQIKIRGQLVAPEEIESALLGYGGVQKAAVVAKEVGNAIQLIAYVQMDKEGTATAAILKHHLRQKLPGWMLPHHILMVKELPVKNNGKIDISALADFAVKPEISALPDNDPVIGRLQHIWKKILKLSDLPMPAADFFDDLGGDSLAVLEVMLEAESQGLHFPVGLLGNLRSIASLAVWIKHQDQFPSSDRLPVEVLKKDACLSLGRMKCSEHTSPGKSILLTGSTGFLGMHVLLELLKQTDRFVVCLMREKDKEARNRLMRIAGGYGASFSDAWLKRIDIVSGDISEARLGLNDEQWDKLTQATGDIYHCAGAVNMVQPYEVLKATNLTGLQELSKLACEHGPKRMHVASTLSVFVATDQNSGICYEKDKLDRTRFVYGGYAQSKWAAEYFLHHGPGHLKSNIFRFGLFTGHSVTGIYAPHDNLALFVRGILSLGALPDGDWSRFELDVTPVDYAARAMVHISLAPGAACYHIAGHPRFTLQRIVDSLRQKGFLMKALSQDEWHGIVPKGSAAIAAYMALCRLLPAQDCFERFRAMDLFQATGIVFDQTSTQEKLKGTGIECPVADDALLDKYISRILSEHGAK